MRAILHDTSINNTYIKIGGDTDTASPGSLRVAWLPVQSWFQV
jgi:hypothetical protein